MANTILGSQLDSSPRRKMFSLYLAGPMTGLSEFNYPAFNRVAKQLRDFGFYVVNPAELSPTTDQSWEYYMKITIAGMVTCDGIFLLNGWEASRGARIEDNLARSLAMPRMFESDFFPKNPGVIDNGTAKPR